MKMRRIMFITVIVIGALIAAASIAFRRMAASFEKKMAALTIDAVHFPRVADGTYEGVCDLGIVSAEVVATMSGGRLTDLKLLKHSHGPGYGGEAIIPRILEKQSLQVDGVSGATSSGKVILKAVETALKKGLR